CSCAGGVHGPKRGADPLGDDLFCELLRRQNVDVARVGPLSSLPIDDARDSRPIVIDAESVPLDDRSAQRLQEWVEAGGRLVLFGPPGELRSAFGLRIGEATTRDVKLSLPPELEMGQDEVDDKLVFALDDLAPMITEGRVLRDTAVTRLAGVVSVRLGDRTYGVCHSLMAS